MLAQKADNLAQRIDAIRKIDSIRTSFNNKSDSLRRDYDNLFGKLNDAGTKVHNTIDSLIHLKLPTKRHQQKLDSISLLRTKANQTFTDDLSKLKLNTTGKLESLDLPDQYKEPVHQLASKINSISNLKPGIGQLPEMEIPDIKLPDVKIPDVKLPDIKISETSISKATSQLQTYEGDLKSLATKDINEVKQLPKAIEQRAASEAGIAEVQKQFGALDQVKSSIKQLTEEEAVQQKATGMASKAATDHFAGQEKKLQTAMDKVNKYKDKYPSVESVRDLPKHVPNAMKGKPLVERLIPGLYFQYQVKQFRFFDINPYLGYRIAGKLTSGVGWNYRYAYDKATHAWNHGARVFGPRIYADFNLKKSVIAHAEVEWMNTFVSSAPGQVNDVSGRRWIASYMLGLKKEFKIYKNLKGTILLQYNLFNPLHQAPYASRFNSRIGLEYYFLGKKTQ